MQIREAMSRDVRTIAPGATLKEAARLMGDIDAGVLPVAEGDRLVGMITDRDIAIRAVGAGKGPDTSVGEAMTHDVKYCFDDDDIDEVCENMAQIQVRRLPVVNREKRLVGIVSLADISGKGDAEDVGLAIEGITRPGGERSQSGEARN